jgi:hypothetical protein
MSFNSDLVSNVNAVIDRQLEKQSLQIASTDAGTQSDFNDKQWRKAPAPSFLTLDPDSKVNDFTESQPAKH